MNPPAMYPSPPSVSAPPSRPFPVVRMVFVILGVLALLIAAGVAASVRIFRVIQGQSSAAIPVGDSFLNAMGRHDYRAASDQFTPEGRSRETPSHLEAIEAAIEKHHGTYLSHGQPQWEVQNWNGPASVRVCYPARFTGGPCTFALALVRSGDGYRVSEARYER